MQPLHSRLPADGFPAIFPQMIFVTNAAQMPPVPFTIILPMAYGRMLVNRHDINQTNALFKTGLAIDHAEIALLAQVLQLLTATGTATEIPDPGVIAGQPTRFYRTRVLPVP